MVTVVRDEGGQPVVRRALCTPGKAVPTMESLLDHPLQDVDQLRSRIVQIGPRIVPGLTSSGLDAFVIPSVDIGNLFRVGRPPRGHVSQSLNVNPLPVRQVTQEILESSDAAHAARGTGLSGNQGRGGLELPARPLQGIQQDQFWTHAGPGAGRPPPGFDLGCVLRIVLPHNPEGMGERPVPAMVGPAPEENFVRDPVEPGEPCASRSSQLLDHLV